MNLIQIIRNSFIRVYNHLSEYMKSMLLLQTIRLLIALPIMSFLFYEILSVSRLNGITNSNIMQIITNPKAIILSLLLLLLSVFFVFYELGYYSLLAHHQNEKSDYTFKSLIKELNQKARYFLSVHSLLFALYFLLVLPVVSIGMNPEITKNIKIPNFIVDELLMSTSGKILYYAVILLFTYIALRLIYSILFFVTEKDLSILDAIKKSWVYSKGKGFYNLLLLGVLFISYGILLVVPVTVSFLPLVIAERFLPVVAPVVAGINITLVQLFVFFVSGLLQPMTAIALIETTNEKVEKIQRKQLNKKKISSWFKEHRGFGIVFLIIGVIAIGVNIWSVTTVVYQPTTNIIAHRGFMEKGVENSREALEGAAKAKADFSELDIQETKDGQLAVIHDFNLKRLAGVNKEVYELTLDELQKLSLEQGSYSSRIPSLSEYIDLAKKERIKLLIEVKPHGHESPEMVQNLVALMKEKRVEKDYLVQSLDKKVLDDIKEVDPEIRTGYILPLNIGSLPEMKHDFIVLEEFSVTTSMIKEAREKKIAIFVWTINEDELIKKYLRLDVDGIITNHPDRAIKFRETKEETKTLLKRVQFLLEE